MRKIEEKRGITLITLIITIIVMLILVAVTVNTIVNSDIIGITERTTNLYKEELKEESSNKYSEYMDNILNQYAPNVLN